MATTKGKGSRGATTVKFWGVPMRVFAPLSTDPPVNRNDAPSRTALSSAVGISAICERQALRERCAAADHNSIDFDDYYNVIVGMRARLTRALLLLAVHGALVVKLASYTGVFTPILKSISSPVRHQGVEPSPRIMAS